MRACKPERQQIAPYTYSHISPRSHAHTHFHDRYPSRNVPPTTSSRRDVTLHSYQTTWTRTHGPHPHLEERQTEKIIESPPAPTVAAADDVCCTMPCTSHLHSPITNQLCLNIHIIILGAAAKDISQITRFCYPLSRYSLVLSSRGGGFSVLSVCGQWWW